ncbi:hypothetical protein [Dongia sp.]|uniref:hypothetical protein n=1 Tax=Dongia sp. TaxID=1977262 RepID=UPI0035B3980C
MIAVFAGLWQRNHCGRREFPIDSEEFMESDVSVAAALDDAISCFQPPVPWAVPHPLAKAPRRPIFSKVARRQRGLKEKNAQMIYLVALIFPPLALLLYGKIFQAIFNLLLYILAWLVFIFSLFLGGSPGFVIWLIAAAHAVLVINNAKKDARIEALVAGRRPE